MSKVPDRTRPTMTSRLGISLPAALGVLLVAAAITFGSGLGPGHSKPGHGGTETAQGQKGGGHGNGQGGYHKPGHGNADKNEQPSHNRPDKTPKPEPSPKPAQQQQPGATPKPQHDYSDKTPKPEPMPPTQGTAMNLDAQGYYGKVKLFWSKFSHEEFAYYKVVRSTDATVSWPMGGNDTLIKWTSDKYETWFKDYPPCGTQFFYRVFAVTSGSDGYQVLAASNVDSGTAECDTSGTPKPTPTPAPPTPAPATPAPPTPAPPTPAPPTTVTLGFTLTGIDGGVTADWQSCTMAGFANYRVVRSQTNVDPMYPLNSGTELVATINNPNNSVLVDLSVTTGQTWTYRVLCMASDGFVLGITPALSITVP